MSNDNDIELTTDVSPFDKIRRADEQGEYWSARDLQPMLGYTKWQNFEEAIERAKASAEMVSAGQGHFTGVSKMFLVGNGASREFKDYRLSRYASYLIAMNGDPRKAQVAAAQTYFAARTRQAELAEQQQYEIPTTLAGALRLAADQAEALELSESRNLELVAAREADQPAVLAWETWIDEGGLLSIRDVARGFDVKEREFFDLLRQWAWIEKIGTTARTYPREHGYMENRRRYDKYGQFRRLQGFFTKRGIDAVAKRLRREFKTAA